MVAEAVASRRAANPDKAPAASTESVAVTKAAVRAAHKLGLTNRTLAGVIGLSEPTISRMSKGEFWLSRSDRKSFELSVLFIRLFRSLDAIVGGDEGSARSWLNSENAALGAAPINLIQSVSGLVNVVHYLDSRRDRV
jgi:DNA-binding XRE family transcriptional regulator